MLGHDVAEDMLAEGLGSVTMVQRGATRAFTLSSLARLGSQT